MGWKLSLLSRQEEKNGGRKGPFGVAGISVGFSIMPEHLLLLLVPPRQTEFPPTLIQVLMWLFHLPEQESNEFFI